MCQSSKRISWDYVSFVVLLIVALSCPIFGQTNTVFSQTLFRSELIAKCCHPPSVITSTSNLSCTDLAIGAKDDINNSSWHQRVTYPSCVEGKELTASNLSLVNETMTSLRDRVSRERYSAPQCLDHSINGSAILLRCPEDEVATFAKCCPEDSVFDEVRQECRVGHFHKERLEWHLAEDNLTAFNSSITLDADSIIPTSGLLTPEDCHHQGMKVLTPDSDPEDAYVLLTDGRVYLTELRMFLHSDNNGTREYCLEEFVNDGNNVSSVLSRFGVVVCNMDGMSTHANMECMDKFSFYPYVMVVSCLGLSATILVYLLLPELRNLPGKILMSLAGSLLGAYVLLVVSQLSVDVESVDVYLCVGIAITMDFLFLSAFCWMTIMSLDIFFTFSQIRLSAESQICGRKSLLKYSVLGWGLPLVICALTLAIDLSPLTPTNVLKPKIGLHSCWFSGQLELLLYFYGPVGTLSLMNILLFVVTVVGLSRLRNGREREGRHHVVLRRHSSAEHDLDKVKARLSLNLKLFAVMGITWIFEVVSWVFPDPSLCWLWYIIDVFNILQGLWIFLIFVVKKQVLNKVLNRFRGACC